MLTCMIVVLVGLCTFITYILSQRNISFSWMFLLYWGTISLISVLKGAEGKENIYWLILWGCIGFFCGWLLVKILGLKNHLISENIFEQKILAERENIIIVLYMGALIIDLYLAYLSWTFFKNGNSWGAIRGLFLSGVGLSETMIYIKAFYLIPLTYISGIIFSVEFFFSKTYGKRITIMILTFFTTVIYALASEGRMVLLYFLVCIVITYLSKKDRKKISKKSKRYMLLILGVGYLISSYRAVYSGADNVFIKVIESIISYAVLPIDLMEYYIPVVDESNITGLGQVFVGCIIDLISNITKIFSISIFQTFQGIDSLIASFSDAVYIDGKRTNSFVSLFTYFYIDFRIGGVVIESMIFGMICTVLESKKSKSFFDFCIYLFMWVVFSMLPIRWGLYNISVLLGFLYLWIIFGKKQQNLEMQKNKLGS